MVCFVGNNFFYVISFFFLLRYVGLCVILTMSSSYFLLMFYFCLLFLITRVVYPPSALVIYLSDLSLDSVLISLELLLCGVSSGHCVTEFWPLIDREILLTVGVLSKKVLHVLDFSVPRYISVIGP